MTTRNKFWIQNLEQLEQHAQNLCKPSQTTSQCGEGSVGHTIPPLPWSYGHLLAPGMGETIFSLRDELTSLQRTTTQPRIFRQHKLILKGFIFFNNTKLGGTVFEWDAKSKSWAFLMLSPKLVAVWGIRWCSPAGENMTLGLGFEVSKASHHFVSSFGSQFVGGDVSAQLLP